MPPLRGWSWIAQTGLVFLEILVRRVAAAATSTAAIPASTKSLLDRRGTYRN